MSGQPNRQRRSHTAKSKRTVRADIPTDVWDRLAAEAAAKDMRLGGFVAALITARDRRKQEAVSGNQTAQQGLTSTPAPAGSTTQPHESEHTS